MHRLTVSQLAFIGAIVLVRGDGRADPQSAKPAARSENVAATADTEAPAKRDKNLAKEGGDAAPKNDASDAKSKAPSAVKADSKKPAAATSEVKKSAAAESGTKKSDGANGASKKDAATDARSKNGASAAVRKEATSNRDATSNKEAPGKDATRAKGASGASAAKGAPAWTKPKPGVVKMVRGGETLEVRVLDRRQKLVPTTLSQFAKFLRSKSGADHAIDPRLVTLVATVSDHFGGRELTVVSGFRPYRPDQYSRHSNHNQGRALDFSIKGIANETLRDFCRTLKNVGVGYYPNSLFVHLDVRDTNAYWVDYAAPGQPARYRAPDVKDDDDNVEGVATVDGGPTTPAARGERVTEDVARGKHAGRGGDAELTGERGIFIVR
jgi:uncharacterized protein YcbK (DUF882 family)